jgi:hypothetical protein
MKYPIAEVVESYHSRGESFRIICRDSCDLSTCSSLSLDFSEVSLTHETSLPRDDNRTSKDSEFSFFQSNAAIVFDLESSDDDFTYETIDSKHDDSSSSSSSSVCWSESLAASQSHHGPTAYDGQGDPLVNGSKNRKNSMLMLSIHTSGAIAHDPEHDEGSDDSSDDSSLAESIISNAPFTDEDVEYASESEESSYHEQSYSRSTFKQQCYESDSESTRSISDSFEPNDDSRPKPVASPRSLKRIKVSSNLKKLNEHMNSIFGKAINAADVKEPSRRGRAPRRNSSLVEKRSRAQSSRQKLQRVFDVLCLRPLRTQSFIPTTPLRKTVENQSYELVDVGTKP